jgi:hypothetical protein
MKVYNLDVQDPCQVATIDGEYWLTKHTNYGGFYSIKYLLQRVELLGYTTVVMNRIDGFRLNLKTNKWEVM